MSLKRLSEQIHEDGISLWLLLKGTRSREGQLARSDGLCSSRRGYWITGGTHRLPR